MWDPQWAFLCLCCISTVQVLITTCCAPGVCASPDSQVGTLIPSVMLLELMRVGLPNGMRSLVKQTPESSLTGEDREGRPCPPPTPTPDEDPDWVRTQREDPTPCPPPPASHRVRTRREDCGLSRALAPLPWTLTSDASLQNGGTPVFLAYKPSLVFCCICLNYNKTHYLLSALKF